MERFRNEIGEYIVLHGILVSAEPKDVNGSPTSCTIQLLNLDLRATIVLWGARCASIEPMIGKVISLEAKVGEWRGAVQLAWSEPSKLVVLEDSPEAYIPVADSYYRDLYRINSLLQSLDDERVCTKITKRLFDVCYDTFIEAPAGKSMHHNYKGGLLEHTVEVASLVLGIVETHRNLEIQYLDATLAMCGALLHDIGKVREYGFENYSPCFTLEGKVNSHLFLGATMVYQVAADLGYASTHPDVMKLVNIIQSHHGTKEFGNLADPLTLEAEVVSHCDSLSARGQILARVKENAKSGVQLAEGFISGKKFTVLV